jgi:NADH-quinone oxidoreductase subunit I
VDDLRWLGRGRYNNEDALKIRQSTKARGVFTVQYPEEKLTLPEEFRYLPFLVYEENQDGTRQYLCTSCGICTKVCPPQCIWIVRSNDPDTGRPIPTPTEFSIDIDICMSCGLCAEFCPFDAIKMDHVYELASDDRLSDHIFNKKRLGKPASYYAGIRPMNYAREETAREEKEALKAAKKKKN